MVALTKRWYPLKSHAIRNAFWLAGTRFRVCSAGRRSGKTELAKRFLILCAISFHAYPDGRFYFAAPTTDQVRTIYWKDAKLLTPRKFIAKDRFGRKKINETLMTIELVNGAVIRCVGMDKPERVEGDPIDGLVLAEYGNMHEDTWGEHMRPALSTLDRLGWAWFIGVPEGRNHYYRTYQRAMKSSRVDWSAHTWKSAEILDATEIAAAKDELDPLTFEQEYEGAWISFAGRAYHRFNRDVHAVGRVRYDPGTDIHICLDFNNAPGVMAIVQDLPAPRWLVGARASDVVACVVDEVFIEKGSNTYRVCDRFLALYGEHKRNVYVYGDSSGGSNLTSSVKGSDWDLVSEKLRPAFGNRMMMKVPKANPNQKPRVNSLNARFENASGLVRACVDSRCENTIFSLEGTAQKPDGSIAKPKGEKVTHISDALGYMTAIRWPLGGGNKMKVTPL